MNLDYLKSFFTIVKHNSISKAAKELHLTQPGLSMQLQSLENEIGAKLLTRSNKGVELTAEGKIVFEHTITLLEVEANMHNNIRNLKMSDNTLSIYSCNCLGAYVLPCNIYIFKEIYPNLTISLEVLSTKSVIKKIINHETNIGILTSKYDAPELSMHPFIEDSLILVSNPNVECNQITLEDLKKIPLIMQNDESSLSKILYKSLDKHNISADDLNIVLTMNSSQSVKSAIASGHGFAFLPSITIDQELKSSTIKKIMVKDLDTKFNYYFAYRKNYIFTPFEEKFKDFLLSRKNNLLRKNNDF